MLTDEVKFNLEQDTYIDRFEKMQWIRYSLDHSQHLLHKDQVPVGT